MVHSILKGLGGIQQYGVFSMCLFALVFGGAIVTVFLMKRRHLDYMASVAIDDEDRAQEQALERQSVEALKR